VLLKLASANHLAMPESKVPEPSVVSFCTAEFVGTFLLVFTVGCNVLAGNPVWGGVSIACSLMVSIYALGAVSGANFNPAVSIALGLAGKMEWKKVGVYCGVQLAAGLIAAVCYSLLFQANFNLGPTASYAWWQAMLGELLYTFMLCFVVLNVAASKKQGGKNQHYGLAIGYVIIAGAYGPGAISGGCFNPAVAFGVDASSIGKGFGWCLMYSVFELLGAGIAAAAFLFLRPEERGNHDVPAEYTLSSKLIAESIGTFMLVLTVGLNVLVESKAAAFSIAASLMCMIYAVGDVSGGHFNPAVTLAIFCRGLGDPKCEQKAAMKKAGCYVGVQLAAGFAGALMYAIVHGGVAFPIGPGEGFGWGGVAIAEVVFTSVLCYVVLCVATVAKDPSPELTGFIIGSCVTVGGLAIGKISGGSLNPAVSFGISLARILFGGAFGNLQRDRLYDHRASRWCACCWHLSRHPCQRALQCQ
jgi:aquaporin Z